MSKGWVYAPHSGGRKPPPSAQERIRGRILAYAKANYAGKFNRIDVHFRGQFCYVDAYTEPFIPEDFNEKLLGETREEHLERLRITPTHLCRLRYFGNEDSLSMAFYAYSSEKYEPCLFDNGSWTGTPEEAFEACAMYLSE
jgi:hypothetical protein